MPTALQLHSTAALNNGVASNQNGAKVHGL
jgi:hypothetical protein